MIAVVEDGRTTRPRGGGGGGGRFRWAWSWKDGSGGLNVRMHVQVVGGSFFLVWVDLHPLYVSIRG